MYQNNNNNKRTIIDKRKHSQVKKNLIESKGKVKKKHLRNCNVFKIEQKAKANIKVFSLVLKVSWGLKS